MSVVACATMHVASRGKTFSWAPQSLGAVAPRYSIRLANSFME